MAKSQAAEANSTSQNTDGKPNLSLATSTVASLEPGANGLNIKGLDGPDGSLILGNLKEFRSGEMHEVLSNWNKDYGPMFRLRLANQKAIVLSEPEIVRKILRDRPEHFRRISKMQPLFKELSSNGLFVAEGEQWKRFRKLSTPAFNPDHLRTFFPTLKELTNRMKQRWHQHAESQKVFDFKDEAMRYSVDVLTSLAFGQDLNTVEEEKAPIQQHMNVVLPTIEARLKIPVPYWRYFKLDKDKAVDESMKILDETVVKFIEVGRQRIKENPNLIEEPSNLLEAMLVSTDDNGSKFTDEEIFHNIMNFWIAGENTTSGTISWLAYHIANYPEVQQKLQEEADRVLGEDPIITDFKQINQLTYLDAVLQESMRLRPVVPQVSVEPLEDMVINGYHVPAGTIVFLLLRESTKLDENFESAREFNPDRFLKAASACPHNSKVFLPFGTGSRTCPALFLATTEIKVLFSMLLKNFTLAPTAQNEKVKEKLALTVMPDEVSLTLSER